jgi:signal transduction histidine kinase
LVPAITLLWLGGLERQRAEVREFHGHTLNLARVTAQAYQRRIETARQLLISLSHNPDMRNADTTACDRLVRSLVRDYGGLYATIGRADRTGAVQCLALDNVPPEARSIADREYFQRAMASGGFVVGDFMYGKVRRQPTLAFAYPMRDDAGEIVHVIFANIDLTVLSRSLESETQIAGTTISLLDRNGALIARSTDAERFFGITPRPTDLALMRQNGEMVTTFAGLDAVRRIFAITTVRDASHERVAFATVGVDETNLAALVDSGRRVSVLTLILLGVVLIGTAWLGAEWLVRRPIQKLVVATEALASGQLEARTPPVGGVQELEGLASAFNRMAEKLQQRDLHLREGQRLEAVGQLAGGVAHDFNNLLQVIIGYADVLTLEGDAQREYLAELRKAAERAGSLTQQLLAFSRRQVLRRAALDLNQVITDIVSLLERATGGDISIELVLDPVPVMVLADRAQIEQVLLNLVVNARDAMPSGGIITIATHNRTVDSHEAAAMGVDSTTLAEFSVSDTGIGMDAATRSRVFEPFFTTKGARGTGLGLATVYGVVKQSGGHIYCISEPGHGTEFRVCLPRHLAQQEPAATIPSTLLSTQSP